LQRQDLASSSRQGWRTLQTGEGFVEVTSIRRISLADITPELSRRSGFRGVVDLLKVAKHGSGENVYLIEFKYDGERKTEQR